MHLTFPPSEDPSPPATPALLLRVAGDRHRVGGVAGCEVAECPPAVALPMAPPWLLGVVVHKGEALPLVDLGEALGGGRGRGPRPRMLVTRGAGFPVAFLVDDVDADDGRQPAPALDLATLARTLLLLPGASGGAA